MALRGPRRIRRAARTLAAPGPVDRLLAMSGRSTTALRDRLFRGPLAELDGGAGRRAIEARLDGVPGRPAAGDAVRRRAARARRRHAPLLRPRVDGPLARGSRAVPRPRARRVLRHDPGAMKVRRTTTKYVLKNAARGLVPDRIIDKPKIGFFAASVDGWFAAQTRGVISDYLLAPNPRYADFLDRDEVAKLVQAHADGARRKQRPPAAVAADARGLAVVLSSARVQRRQPAPRACRLTCPRLVRGGHAGARRGGEPPSRSPTRWPRRRSRPRAG